MFQRIMVIGSPGAGKSTFSRVLRDRLGLPLYYLDCLWHREDKTTVSREEFDKKLSELLAGESWIIDGNYNRTLEARLQRCDTVFLLDYPLEVCLSGIGGRIGKKREDLPWLEEELDEEFYQWVVDFPRTQLPRIYELLERYQAEKNVIVFRSRQEAEEFLKRDINRCREAERGKRRVFTEIRTVRFTGKQNIPWNQVELYLKKYIGKSYVVEEYKDIIWIAGDFPDEYAESVYTKKLRGALAKVKANAAQIIDQLIIHATNRRWVKNKAEKHNRNASEGWLRYDTYFSMSVQGNGEAEVRVNKYMATLIVRKTAQGLFLYDMINIKKEASTPLESR